MASNRPNRRLTAIMAADVVGYSRAMEADEEGTLVRLGALRKTVIDPLIDAHDGRVFKTMGDGFLVEFASSVDALRCAVEIQQNARSAFAAVPEAQRLLLRIGVNIGDVVAEGDDLLGNGVNVAARLETLAAPGGICISGRVFEDVERTVEADFEYLGPQPVKNMERPVEAYAVRLFPDTPESGVACLPATRLLRPAVLAGAALLLSVLGVVGWFVLDRMGPGVGTRVQSELVLPDRPSIAVLPFANLSGDEGQRYFADGITEDLTTDLSKLSGLFVIARNSAFAYRNSEAPVSTISAELGVRYILQGSVRRAGGELRINARLDDGLEGNTVWAERFDGTIEDIFALQDTVTREIVSVLSVQLSGEEDAELSRRDTRVPEAHDAFLRGWGNYQAQSPESLKRALAEFQKAIDLDPEFGRAHAAIAAVYWQISQRWWHGKFGFSNAHRARAHAETELAKALAWDTPLAHQLATAMLSQQGRHTEALAEGAKALGLDPNDADTFATLAGALSLAGDAAEALTMIEQAIRLNPRAPGAYSYQLGLAEFGLGNFTRAADALEEAIRLNEDDRWSKRLLVATYGHLGRTDEAMAIVERDGQSWFGTDPFTVRAVAYWYPYQEQSDIDRLKEGLRKAGLAE